VYQRVRHADRSRVEARVGNTVSGSVCGFHRIAVDGSDPKQAMISLCAGFFPHWPTCAGLDLHTAMEDPHGARVVAGSM